MKIPYTHIKEATKNIDKHNQERSKQIEKHHNNESERIAKEISNIGVSKGFQKEMNWNKRHPGHLRRVLLNHYGRKFFQ